MKTSSQPAMRNLSKSIIVALAASTILSTLAATSAIAQTYTPSEWTDSYYYWGLSGGQSRAKFDEQRLANSQLRPGIFSSGISGRDDTDTAFRILGGYQINRYWGIEAAYFDLGRSSFSSSTFPTGNVNGEVKVRGGSLDLVGTLPLSDRFALLGRIGGHYSRTYADFNGNGAANFLSSSNSNRKTDGKVGAGLQYAFSQNFMVRLEGDRYRVSDAVGSKGYINTAMLSLVFPFNRTRMSMPTPIAAQPTYVAPAPQPIVQPAPVVVAPPPPQPPATPSMRRVTFSAESLFSFDKSDIHSEGKASLDKFAKELETTRYERVTVIGHTDRLGTPAYNQKLSERRAETIKSYLVTSGGVDASRINAMGKGEETSITKAEDCIGKRATPKLIACLQPDRRVDVEVTGMR
jgi:OmpA-OmpF porin, OOP family